MVGFLVLLTPWDIDRVVCEGFFDQTVEHTYIFPFHLDFDGFPAHRSLVLFLKGRTAEGQVIKGDNSGVTAACLNSGVNRVF